MSRKLSRPFANWVTDHRSASFWRLPCGSAYRVKGRPKPGASGPLTRRRVQYAGEGWRARVIALASLASLDAYLPAPTFAAIRGLCPGLKPVIARVRLQCLTNLLSAGAWPASSCMRVTLEFLQEHAPSKKTVASATRYGHGHVHFKRRPHIGFAPCMMAWLRRLKRVSAGRPRVSHHPSDSATARSRGAVRPRRSRCAAPGGSAPCPGCAG